MSHWSTVKTVFTNAECLIEALKELYPEHEVAKNATVRGYYSNRNMKAEVVLKAKPSQGHYDIGFQKQKDGTYSQVTDWFGARSVAGCDETTFAQKLRQMYSKHTSIKQARKYGWSVKEKTKENGDVELTLVKY